MSTSQNNSFEIHGLFYDGVQSQAKPATLTFSSPVYTLSVGESVHSYSKQEVRLLEGIGGKGLLIGF